jgi:hypothetical protein
LIVSFGASGTRRPIALASKRRAIEDEVDLETGVKKKPQKKEIGFY